MAYFLRGMWILLCQAFIDRRTVNLKQKKTIANSKNGMVRELLTSAFEGCAGGKWHEINLLGGSVHIQIDDNLGEGGNVWSAVQDLANHLIHNAGTLKSKQILELGSGPGALSIACAMNGADVVASDAPWVTSLTRSNAESPMNASQIAAAGGTLAVVDYLWGAEAANPVADTPPDIVLVCECVYQLEGGGLHEALGLDSAPTGDALLESLLQVCGPATTLFLANRLFAIRVAHALFIW